jgi:hypothetical protein
MYATNRLHRGDKVEVVVEGAGGWLAIRPPQGSFSWINNGLLQPLTSNQNMFVVAPEGAVAEVRVGSALLRDRPTVVGSRLQRGAQVRAIGPGLNDRDGIWLPIEPPPGEMRYLPSQAVTRTPPAAAQTVLTAGVAGTSTFTAAAAPAAPQAAPTPDGLWRQAQQAERAGQTAEAIRLYQQAGTANLSVNQARAMEAFDRARWLDEQAKRQANQPGGFSSAPSTSVPNASSEVHYTGSPDRIAAVAADANAPTVRLAPPSAMNPPNYCPPAAPGVAAGPEDLANSTGGTGWLRRAGRMHENQKTYVLDNEQGIPMCYVTASPGVQLDIFVNRRVELAGRAEYNGELRNKVMVVEKIQAAP